MNRFIPSRLLRWSLYTGFFFLLVMTLLRLFFFYAFKQLGLTLGDALPAFILGIRFDLRMICVLMLALILVGNIGPLHPYRSSKARVGWFWVLTIFCLLFILFYIVDFIHYEYLAQRLNASVLNYTKDAGISMTMIWQSYPVIRLIFVLALSTFAMAWVIRFLYRKAAPIPSRVKPRIRWIYFIIFFLLCAIAIFGRIGQYPLRWSYAFSLGSEARANLSLNPIQSFFSTLKFRKSSYDLKKTKEYYPLMAAQLGMQKPDAEKLNYERVYPERKNEGGQRPNIVIVICESFSAYKSSMWGNPLNTTPYFDQLCKEGVFFDRCFTPSWGTARGVWTTITGIPDVETPKTASRNMAMVSQHTIINDFKGYDKSYFLGGSTTWANIRGLLRNNIDSLHLYEGDNFKSPKIDVWGISDKNLFLEANGYLKDKSQPFVAVIQTADNHRPYTIPSEDLVQFKKVSYPQDTLSKYGFENNDELNAFRFTDYCYQQFIEAAKKEAYFKNTIFVFVGDHGIRGNTRDMFPKAWYDEALSAEHVPLLFYAPGLLKPQRRATICSQADLLPSVASLAGIGYRNTTLGRDLFSDPPINDTSITSGGAFIIDPDFRVIGMVDSAYYYRRSLLTGKEEFVSILNNDPVTAIPEIEKRKERLKNLADAYYYTSYYLLFNNKRN